MMKENVLDVLMYLFENYMDEGPEFNPDQETLKTELTQAGFPRGDINKALSWLEELAALRASNTTLLTESKTLSVRVYSQQEQEKINVEARGFILFLEHSGVLDALTRELVIDRVMALEAEEIDLEQLKWVILMVLFNQPGHEQAYAWMEDLVFNETQGHLH
jgi:Smg protein